MRVGEYDSFNLHLHPRSHIVPSMPLLPGRPLPAPRKSHTHPCLGSSDDTCRTSSTKSSMNGIGVKHSVQAHMLGRPTIAETVSSICRSSTGLRQPPHAISATALTSSWSHFPLNPLATLCARKRLAAARC